jgi:hypothetical protein
MHCIIRVWLAKLEGQRYCGRCGTGITAVHISLCLMLETLSSYLGLWVLKLA